MRKTIVFVFLLVIILFLGVMTASAETASLLLLPTTILQGNPFMAQIDGAEISSIRKLSFDGKKIGIFLYQNRPTALVPIDLNKKPGSYELQAEFYNGEIIKKNVDISKRDKAETPLGIPEKLGGNTKESQDKLVATLNEDNKSLVGIRTNSKALWTKKFIAPLKQIFVTAPYGNSRKTGVYSIPHKGVDYRAKEGTEVMAINRGVVRVTKTFRNHGKTIVIDHGLGLMSFYLHLSKIKVKVGDVVERGQIVGLSGHTGYTLGAHLHFSIRINDIAIDPEKFLELFQ